MINRIQKRAIKKIVIKHKIKTAQGSIGNIPAKIVPAEIYKFNAIMVENSRPRNLPNSSIKPLLNPIKLFEAMKKNATASRKKIINKILFI